MAARDNLSSQFWGPGGNMFHISPVENRESIESQGLVGKLPPLQNKPKPFKSEAPGVFVADEPTRTDEAVDVYVVDTANLPAIVDDALAMDKALNSRFIPGSIPPSRIQRLQGEPRQQIHKASRESFPWKNPLA